MSLMPPTNPLPSTARLQPEGGEPVSVPPQATQTRWQAIWWARWVILAAAIIAAALAIGVSKLIPTRYSASAIVRVTLPTSAGLSEQSVQAANDLASQYTQIATAAPVVEKAEASLGPAGAGLSSEISASTVSSENLVQITARGDSAEVAKDRANATAAAFAQQLNTENAQNAATAARASARQLEKVQSRLQKAQQRLDTVLAIRESGGTLTAHERAAIDSLQSEVSSLEGLQQSLFSSQVSTGTPTLKVFSPATGASKTQPRPSLYAIVAFIVVLLVAAQIATLVGTNRRV